MILDLTKGICETNQYKAWKFPGGEIHVQLNERIFAYESMTRIVTRLKTSDDILFLMIVVDTIRKDHKDMVINLFIPCMPYQQADRDFGKNECFSLKTICNLINSMNFNDVSVYDPHSDVTPALLNNCHVVDNARFIEYVIDDIYDTNKINSNDLIILSSDAGAYKKIFKLCEKVNFTGQIECCSKTRDHETGKVLVKVPSFDPQKIVLIVDDLVLGGRTFLSIKEQIKNECYLAISHGILSNGGFSNPIDDLLSNGIKSIYTTNSCSDFHDDNRIKVFSII